MQDKPDFIRNRGIPPNFHSATLLEEWRLIEYEHVALRYSRVLALTI